jgi:hypothetical protein
VERIVPAPQGQAVRTEAQAAPAAPAEAVPLVRPGVAPPAYTPRQESVVARAGDEPELAEWVEPALNEPRVPGGPRRRAMPLSARKGLETYGERAESLERTPDLRRSLAGLPPNDDQPARAPAAPPASAEPLVNGSQMPDGAAARSPVPPGAYSPGRTPAGADATVEPLVPLERGLPSAQPDLGPTSEQAIARAVQLAQHSAAGAERRSEEPAAAGPIQSASAPHGRALQPQISPRWEQPAGQPSPATPTVKVSIGRIDIRAVAPPQPARPASRPEPPRGLSLKEYLARRSGGRQ